MFSKLVSRNSKSDRKNNGLYFSSMVLSIISFYIILSLSHQDVMHFLKQIESDAVNKLFSMIPILYVATLFILFFLVYFASSMQMERRKHEFGVYLTLGMRRSKLFLLLLLEDLRNSVLALGIGLPISILISELISLITAKIVGLGIIEHQFSLSTTALLYTVIGFLAVKLAVFVLLSAKTANMEIGNLLAYSPSGMKKLLPKGGVPPCFCPRNFASRNSLLHGYEWTSLGKCHNNGHHRSLRNSGNYPTLLWYAFIYRLFGQAWKQSKTSCL